MSMLGFPRRVAFVSAAGVLLGSIAAVVTGTVATATDRAAPGAVFDVTHAPPILTLPGERAELEYETYCAAAGADDPEAGCPVRGAVFARRAGGSAFVRIPLEPADDAGRKLVAPLPDPLREAAVVEYYAELESPETGARTTLPSGGAAAPAVSHALSNPTTVALSRKAFGKTPRAGERVAFARWGDGPDEVGLEGGRTATPIGGSSFDVDASGSVIVLDHVHRRLLRWTRAARTPERIPVSINGTIADLAAAPDGSVYVLETTSRDEREPLIRRFDDQGRELEAVEAAERGAAQIRMGAGGPIVLQRPSNQWMPAAVAGVAAEPAIQRRNGRMARSLRSGGEVLTLRVGNELRAALLSAGRVTRSWRITSDLPLAEVQLAEPLGSQFLVVVRVYDEAADEFAALVLDPAGLRARMTLAAADWAESAPLARFRLAGRSLYRLGSSPAGVFVDRFDLEVR